MSNELKNEVLQRSSNGLAFFKLIFGDQLQSENEKRFKNVKNPFYNDKNASLSIYENDTGRWCFKDYGNVDFSGDVFTFCALHYKLDVEKDFGALLYLMKEDLNQNQLSKTVEMLSYESSSETNKKKIVDVKLFEVELTEKARKFWSKYGVTYEILKLNNVKEISGYRILYDDEDCKVKNYKTDMVFAYEMHKSAKIYIPNPKCFLYVGDKPKNYLFGQNFNTDSDLFFLAAGEKDVLTLHGLGYQAVCLNSETSLPTRDILKYFYESEIDPIILYDCDETGRKCSGKLSEKTGWRIADLSAIISQESKNNIKDISDYVCNKLSKEKLKEFLDSFSGVSSIEITKEVEEVEDIEEAEEMEIVAVEKSGVKYSPISPIVFDNLPELLKSIISPINQDHKRDLVLTGSLVVLSNLINVSGVYGNATVYPNLYLFITAPASAGKSVLRWVRKLGSSLNKRFSSTYKMDLAVYKENNKKGEIPKRQSVFVSANSSTSAFMQQLNSNDGRGIMLETEADSLIDVMKNQWGNFSDVLRRCFEFEPLSSSRVDTDKTFDIEKPRLSIVLSGTKNQLFDLIPSAQNGLFSRFLFFEFPLIKKWEDVFESKESLDDHYYSISQKVLKYYDETILKNINFEISMSQKTQFNRFYEQKQDEFDLLLGEDSIASIRRIGSMQFRIAMLLSTIRMLDENKSYNNLICGDIDFEISEILARWFINHTKKIYAQLPNKPKQYKELKTIESQLLDKLPNQFSFKVGLEVAELLSIPKGTFENMLRRFKKLKIVSSFAHGQYVKNEI